MGIMTRFVRIFKADVHGIMDQLEDKGLLLKQYLRDMEDALSQKEICLRKVNAARNLAQRENESYRLEIEKIEQDLTVAIQKDRDDIARLLIRKIIPLTKLRNGVRHHIDDLDREFAALKEGIDQRRIQYEDLKHRARQYFLKADRSAWQKAGTVFSPDTISEDLSTEEIELELLQRKAALSAT